MYDIVFEAGALLLLALTALIYALMPVRRRFVLHGRFVGMACDAGVLSLSNGVSTTCVKDDGVFGMRVRPGDSATWSIWYQETHLATMRVDLDVANSQGPTGTQFLEIGEIDLGQLYAHGEHCRILQLEGATVILSAVGPRIPAREHQLLDRVPYWLTERPLSQ